MNWFVYILECVDKSLYTGITNDVEKRVAAHNKGTASKYTRCRRPVKIVYLEQLENRSLASKRELEIKSFSKKKKNDLILG
ncbi:MAG: GIY-YIG nuclease superfamily protein [bacterium ADurb.Bin157]|jgi:putative endonuclease|nr:GIY-YIG nuclease family protein [Candidatus Riflebacteria bacterium]NCB45592.1 GIY-YIG nuclease family protein [bacterium]OQB50987.1 MAG: GIY-YIG nuclease superfamily protein [bacterium ADurb.Bin157]MDD2624340.1 GIY-YIG nuclease family protein [Candidatus Riflebacteria bacterium]MDD3375920.1 GIY-YIG nuclease family protein [Candidatus Riflebacteria bacterium]